MVLYFRKLLAKEWTSNEIMKIDEIEVIASPLRKLPTDKDLSFTLDPNIINKINPKLDN